MKKTVPILDGQIETRIKINQFLTSLQIQGIRIKTKEQAVLYAIEQAERVTALEDEIKRLSKPERIKYDHEKCIKKENVAL